MTDTTDIKALREQAETSKVCGGIFAISGEQALSLLDQLEAERQRADANEPVRCEGVPQHVHDMIDLQETIDELRAELAELKGEQVPVAFTAARWLDTRCKLSVWTDRESAVMEIGDNSKVAELYGRPQKPVVLPQAHKVRAGVTLTGDERNVMIPCDDGNWLSRLDVEHSIKMAGGIVKDGG